MRDLLILILFQHPNQLPFSSSAVDGNNNVITTILLNGEKHNHLLNSKVTRSFTLDHVKAQLQKCKSEILEFMSSNLIECVGDQTLAGLFSCFYVDRTYGIEVCKEKLQALHSVYGTDRSVDHTWR